ncbi:KilA-N domain-containing protein [Flagellimonas sp.]|uniref:KilA-N domain-containing protein n=1 Tax=Flagellimonas sp. TaxID=2058762 RepID=UPI003BA907FA
MKTLEFIYQETEIHFLVNPLDKNVMVNATEMAKLFNKEPKDFLRLEGTKKFINYQLEKNDIVADVPRYIKENIYYSNNKAGTFMTRKLALKFAAWLDIQFEDWVFETIDNILFGNYKKHWEAHAQQEIMKVAMEDLKTEILDNPTPDSVAQYFEYEKNYKSAKNAKTKAIRNQLKLFGDN